MFDRINEGRWWDKAWTLVEGCYPVSRACDHCWLLAMQQRFRGTQEVRAVDTEERLHVPMRRKKPTAWAIWSDLFHNVVTHDFLDAALEVMNACHQHLFFALTKRPERIYEMLYDGWNRELGGGVYLRNLYLGITAEGQEEFDARWPHLSRPIIPFPRFLSLEPLLGQVDLSAALNASLNVRPQWVIVGGETGPGARPMRWSWVQLIRSQCQRAGVPFFFKNWGDNSEFSGRCLPGIDKPLQALPLQWNGRIM